MSTVDSDALYAAKLAQEEADLAYAIQLETELNQHTSPLVNPSRRIEYTPTSIYVETDLPSYLISNRPTTTAPQNNRRPRASDDKSYSKVYFCGALAGLLSVMSVLYIIATIVLEGWNEANLNYHRPEWHQISHGVLLLVLTITGIIGVASVWWKKYRIAETYIIGLLTVGVGLVVISVPETDNMMDFINRELTSHGCQGSAGDQEVWTKVECESRRAQLGFQAWVWLIPEFVIFLYLLSAFWLRKRLITLAQRSNWIEMSPNMTRPPERLPPPERIDAPNPNRTNPITAASSNDQENDFAVIMSENAVEIQTTTSPFDILPVRRNPRS